MVMSEIVGEPVDTREWGGYAVGQPFSSYRASRFPRPGGGGGGHGSAAANPVDDALTCGYADGRMGGCGQCASVGAATSSSRVGCRLRRRRPRMVRSLFGWSEVAAMV